MTLDEFVVGLFSDVANFVADTAKDCGSQLDVHYRQLLNDLDNAKAVVQKIDSSLIVDIKTDHSGKLVLVQKLFGGHGYHPVSVDYSNNFQSHHYSFPPPFESKKIKSDLPVDYRIESRKGGALTLKISKRHLGRVELDLGKDSSVSGYRLYTGWGMKFYDSTQPKSTHSTKNKIINDVFPVFIWFFPIFSSMLILSTPTFLFLASKETCKKW